MFCRVVRQKQPLSDFVAQIASTRDDNIAKVVVTKGAKFVILTFIMIFKLKEFIAAASTEWGMGGFRPSVPSLIILAEIETELLTVQLLWQGGSYWGT